MEPYIRSILGLQTPLEIPEGAQTSSGSSKKKGLVQELYRVDSLFNLGQSEEAKRVLSNIEDSELSDPRHVLFRTGLGALLEEKFEDAYECFLQASEQADGMESVLFGERAVNIAFWIACSGKMLEAGKKLDTTLPFAGGVLSFAQYMNGNVSEAETTARKAMQNGFNDPWTIHAVVHCLYSQGRISECSKFMDEYRDHIVQHCRPSAFMKGHMEFHQALCYIDMQDAPKLQTLIRGPLWGEMADSDKMDYWNAAGLLNVFWKAELRGLPQLDYATLNQAMDILKAANTDPAKSAVFGLCIFRWTTGRFRTDWKEKLLQSENNLLQALTNAVDLLYPPCADSNGLPTMSLFSASACGEAWQRHVMPVFNDLGKMGASPEQREVLEDFLGVVAKEASRSDEQAADLLESWGKRNHRPSVSLYEDIMK